MLRLERGDACLKGRVRVLAGQGINRVLDWFAFGLQLCPKRLRTGAQRSLAAVRTAPPLAQVRLLASVQPRCPDVHQVRGIRVAVGGFGDETEEALVSERVEPDEVARKQESLARVRE